MASKRRGSFRPPELRGTLGTLLRTTTGVVRDAIERGAREGRARLDDVRANRRRHDALADLGELVLDLIRRGEIDLAELPEARDLVHQLDDLDGDSATADPAPAPPRPASRQRFDDRPGRDARSDDGTVSSGASAPNLHAARPRFAPRPPLPESPSTLAPTKPLKTWRSPPAAPAPEAPAPAARRSPPHPHDPSRKGGISFDDDDLNEYMHPDDVPPKGAPSDPDDGEA